MKDKTILTIGLLARFLLAAGLSLASAGPVQAGNTAEAQSINLNAGQTRIIDHLKQDSKPAIQVIENPHALVIHDETPGQLILLGAERGQWDLTVTRDDGAQVIYHVAVAALADRNAPLTAPSDSASSSEATPSKPAIVADRKATPETMPTHVLVDAVSAEVDPHPAPVQANEASASVVLPMDNQASAPRAALPADSYREDPAAADSAPAISSSHNYLPAEGISLMTGTSEVIDFPNRLKRVSIADSTIADIQVTTPYQLNLIGHQPGFTTLTIWDRQGHYQEREVRVDAGGKQQVMLNAVIAELDHTKIENQGIDLSVALEKSGLSLASLPGAVASPYGPTSQLTGGTGAVPGVAPPGGQLLPLLLSSTMSYGLNTSSSNYSTKTLFQFLESHNLGRILAQPHLLANSGQSATFLSGGEIPIVLAQALNTSIVFKEFGTKLDCRPTVIGREDIELLLKTEVSEPDYAHGVALFGFDVPAFVTRKAETLVRLKNGQTLIVAGLILHNRSALVSKVPYLGDLPYAGALFRNTAWQDSVTDLMISVRPEIVAPLPIGAHAFEPSERGPLTADEIRTQALKEPDAARPRF
jgi:pilus assembly protein CpaC